MKFTYLICSFFLPWLSSAQVVSLHADETNSLDAQFVNPPDEYRSGVKWKWCNGMINRPGVTGDLEAMKRAGLCGGKLLKLRDIDHDGLLTHKEHTDDWELSYKKTGTFNPEEK